MRMNWKEVERDEVRGQWAAMYVSLNPKGEIVMSRLTWERMGEPKAFVVMFDATNNCVGLKAAHESTRNAFRVGSRGRHGGKRLMVYRLMVDHRLSLPATMEFRNPDRDEDGVLILDLRTARVSERAKAFAKRRGEDV